MGDRRPFYPKKRMILMCDFDRGGFLPPEMVKRRRVVVLRVFSRIALVVPLSATEPKPLRAFHAAIDPAGYGAITVPVWAKADTLAHVSLERLDRINVRGTKYTERIRNEDFRRVLVAVANATGTTALTFGQG
ncbi:MAG TPA: type II toxin-antitoxin system PemK/MazF family toxin [Candidatus Elarobacter sp.]